MSTFTVGLTVVSTKTDCQQLECAFCEALTLDVRHSAVVIYSLNQLLLTPLERREQPRVAPCSSAFHWETFPTSEWNDAASTLQLSPFTSFSVAFGVFFVTASPLSATTSYFSMRSDWSLHAGSRWAGFRLELLLQIVLCQCRSSLLSKFRLFFSRVTLPWTFSEEHSWF